MASSGHTNKLDEVQLTQNPHFAYHTPSTHVEEPVLEVTRFTQFDVLDIPDDIMLRIFGLCTSHVEIPYRRNHTLWILTWTCVRWRNLILNQPLFWCNVRTGRFSNNKKRTQSSFSDIVSEVFRRSQHCLLRLTILTRKVEVQPLLTFSPARISALTINIPSHFLNWNHFPGFCLAHKVHSDELIGSAVPPFDSSTIFPNLTELVVQNWDGGDSTPIKFLEDLIVGCLPYLSHLQLNTREGHDNPNFILRKLLVHTSDIKRMNLTSVILRNHIVMPWPSVHTLLRGCDQLVTLEILLGRDTACNNENHLDMSSIPRIPLNSLKTLIVDVYEPSVEDAARIMGEFVVPLDLPMITQLRLTPMNAQFDLYRDPRVRSQIPAILSNHILTMKTLESFITDNLIGIPVDSYIASLPNLHTLRLETSGSLLSRSAINALGTEEWKTEIQDLTCTIEATDLQLFLNMLAAHWSKSVAKRNHPEANIQASMRKVFIMIKGPERHSLAQKCQRICYHLKEKMGLNDSYRASFVVMGE